MGFYVERILPRLTDIALSGRDYTALRQRVATGLRGEVLEVGFGSGRNLPHLPPEVDRVLAVDPATVGRKLAASRVAASRIPVDYVGLDGQQLPLDDRSVDHVLTTWTLCTIPDVGLALSEIRRVLRPGGVLHFLEHGLSPDAGVARWQHRLTPLQRRVAGGCHLDRPVDDLIAAAGLEITALHTHYVRGPRVLGSMFEGTAVPAA
jgi:ubiquinone/menaquinone biosynthesis C-methylase UbiE